MNLAITDDARDDLLYWATNDRAMLARIVRLLDDTARHPTTGIGKPERLRYDLAGAWSRRINDEHRLVYLIADDAVVILQARFHYQM